MLWLPHFISLLRVAVSPFIVWLLYRANFHAALLLTLAAGLTDWFDGFAARKLGTSGRIGVVLDPLADKVLLVSLFVAMGVLGIVPLWLFLLVTVRDLVIVLGALLLRLLRNRRRFLPSMLGKISTFFQIVLSLLALVQAAFPHPIFQWLKETGVLLTAIFTALSGLDYSRQGIQMARLPPA